MKRASLILVPIAVFVLAGCGSSSTTSATGSAASTGAATTSTPAAASSTPAASATVLVTTKQTKLGTILGAGPKKLTVYLFAADTASKSACSGACAALWPPVITTGKPGVAAHAIAADLGTITRPDGTTQVTYKGHPLYFYAKDGDAGDTYGQGLKSYGADWYVLAPSGNKIDKS